METEPTPTPLNPFSSSLSPSPSTPLLPLPPLPLFPLHLFSPFPLPHGRKSPMAGATSITAPLDPDQHLLPPPDAAKGGLDAPPIETLITAGFFPVWMRDQQDVTKVIPGADGWTDRHLVISKLRTAELGPTQSPISGLLDSVVTPGPGAESEQRVGEMKAKSIFTIIRRKSPSLHSVQ
ncbi:unnamed protein product [Schistocephalus solidus]|uniref:PEX-1N domain-containing protein n=1 Tax=Schistocephalus solidus TaxID=70667 RepID=A0A183SKT9_SCHSO|nr:unnamed protein product [Schistocephalus solidus]